jgi:hypothetical protein
MPITFELRKNDIVKNETALAYAVMNNLSVFFEALPARLEYVLSVVQTITLKDGTKLIGKIQQVEIGRNKDGTPKYQTISNKYAVLDIFIKTEDGSRKKLSRILIAPVDILRYKIDTKALADFSKNINKLVAGDAASLEKLPEAGEVLVKEIKPLPPEAARNEVPVPDKQLEFMLKNTTDGRTASADNVEFINRAGKMYRTSDNALAIKKSIWDARQTSRSYSSLLEWYQAKGQALPTASVRAGLYEGFGLGSAATYIGSGEQNKALLAKLVAEDK